MFVDVCSTLISGNFWEGVTFYNNIDVATRKQMARWPKNDITATSHDLLGSVSAIREQVNEAQTARKRDSEKVSAMLGLYCYAVTELQAAVKVAQEAIDAARDPRVSDLVASSSDNDFLTKLVAIAVEGDVGQLIKDCFETDECIAAITTLFGDDITADGLTTKLEDAQAAASATPARSPSPPPPEKEKKPKRNASAAKLQLLA